MVAETVLGTASCAVANRPDADTIAQATRRPIARDRVPFWDTDLMCVLRQVFVFCDSAAVYLRRPPPPRKPPPPRDPILEEPRLLLLRALDPLYPRVPPPNASRFPPPLRERSRLPMRSAPPPNDEPPRPPPLRLLKPAPPARLLTPPPERKLDRLPPCRPSCCRAPVWRFASESPRAAPPNRSAVARSRYGAPPR